MFDNYIVNYIVIFIVLELFEVQWSRAKTLLGMLSRMYHIYEKSIFLFLLMQPTLYFSIFFMLFTNYNIYALILFSIKFIDIATKLMMMRQVFVQREVSKEMQLMLLTPLHWAMPYVGIALYPFFIYYALAA